jgi:hypothetical protein
MHFSLLIYFSSHHQEAVIVYAAYGIYLAENILKLCKITHVCWIYSKYLMMMNS